MSSSPGHPGPVPPTITPRVPSCSRPPRPVLSSSRRALPYPPPGASTGTTPDHLSRLGPTPSGTVVGGTSSRVRQTPTVGDTPPLPVSGATSTKARLPVGPCRWTPVPCRHWSRPSRPGPDRDRPPVSPSPPCVNGLPPHLEEEPVQWDTVSLVHTPIFTDPCAGCM